MEQLLLFVKWVLFSVKFREFLQKYQNTDNIVMILFLVYSAIMASEAVEPIKR
jgi:hypothetical protein